MDLPTKIDNPLLAAVLPVLTLIGGALKSAWSYHLKTLAECKAECKEREAQMRLERDQVEAARRDLEKELALLTKSFYVLRKKLDVERGNSSSPPPSS